MPIQFSIIVKMQENGLFLIDSKAIIHHVAFHLPDRAMKAILNVLQQLLLIRS